MVYNKQQQRVSAKRCDWFDVSYQPIERTERFLFHKFKPSKLNISNKPLEINYTRLDPRVADILSNNSGKVILAGGAALGIVVPHVREGSDYDSFFVGISPEEAQQIIDNITNTKKTRTGFAL